MKYYHINEAAARTAHNMNSHSDYIEGTQTARYKRYVDNAAEIAEARKKRYPEEAERIDYLLDKYARKLAEWHNKESAVESMCPSVLVSGAGNFPVRKKEKQNARRDALMHEREQIDAILSRIESAGSDAIKSGDAQALEKLRLNDASLVFEPESSLALGFGFRCGFLGLLHLEIVQERLYREFDMDVITTVPNVSYKVYTTQHEVLDVHNPSGLPAPTLIDYIEEPYIKAQIISKSEFFGGIMKLCLDKRGTLTGQHFLSSDRVELNYEMPLAEIVFDFYDKLKSISKGYASFDYHVIGFKKADLVKLDILLNSEPVDALSSLIHRDHAYDFGRKMCEKLKELIPRQQFDIAIQAAIGAKIIARETVKAVRKDVTAKCYGGDITRKRKLLEKQKKGKKRMRQVGNVEVPQSAFMAVLKLD